MAKIGVVSVSAFRSWEKYGKQPQIKYYPKIMQFLGYCPVQYPMTAGQKLKLFREHLGLSYRQVDNLLELSKGCTYRAESNNCLYSDSAERLHEFYSSVM